MKKLSAISNQLSARQRAKALSLLVLMSCWLTADCSPYSADLRPPLNWTSTDAGSVARAAFEWNTRTVPRRHVGPWDAPVFRVGDEVWSIEKLDVPAGTQDRTYYQRHIIEMGGNENPDVFYMMTLHELGHVVGIHTHTKTGVMREEVDSTEFTEEVLEVCRKVNACP